MLSYCLSTRKNAESKNPKPVEKKWKIMLLSKCRVCDSIKWRFYNVHETVENGMNWMNLRQPGFACSACGPFTKNKERIKKQNTSDIFIKTSQVKLVF